MILAAKLMLFVLACFVLVGVADWAASTKPDGAKLGVALFACVAIFVAGALQ